MKRTSAIITSFIVALGVAAWFASVATPASAVVAPAPQCVGNICTGTTVVGGRAVSYAYTQHLSSNGELRIRFNGGAYNTGSMVSFIVNDVPMFASAGYVANTANGAIDMTESDVNPGRTAYERRDSDGCVNCVYDHVLSLRYAGLAPGTYAFSFTVIQYGDSGGMTALPFYVDAAAPENTIESAIWGALPGMDFPCADGVDNDLDFTGDCADVQCADSVGKVSSGSRCQIPEANCKDEFDNDADGKPDCLDQDCDGEVGQPSGTARCQYGNEWNVGYCTDTFDNDADGKEDCKDNDFDAGKGGSAATTCWKKSAYACPAVEVCATGIDDDLDESYGSNWDDVPSTGVNCFDYDCRNNAACPTQEHKTATGVSADAQCFNGIDDDLDTLSDCADPDCRGVAEPPGTTGKVCFEKEFNIGTTGLSGSGYQYCGNAFDDDGDGPKDCADSDCGRQFGNCGPCPAVEDLNFASCTDGVDQDVDGVRDCADTDCAGRLGALEGAAMCAALEASFSCGDGFDNDNDGKVDCADPGCGGAAGPGGGQCEAAGESTRCADAKDNDGDGRIDCADTGCFGVSACAPKTWSEATCVDVPRYASPAWFTTNAPTVMTVVQTAVRVSDFNSIRFVGGGTYPSVTIIVGDATSPAKYYPYAAASPGCTLVDTVTSAPATRFSFTAVPGKVVQIFSNAGPDVPSFNITLKCATSAVPAAEAAFPVSLSAIRSPGNVPEYGDLEFTTTRYESGIPSVSELEPEGIVGATLSVPYGGDVSAARRMRAVPNDPGVGPMTSGICACEIEVDGLVQTTDASCVGAPLAYFADATISVRARAEDGADNRSAWTAMSSVTVNVTPAVKSELTISPAQPFFRNADPDATLTAEFVTALNDIFTFGTACDVQIKDENGSVRVNGPMGPAFTIPTSPLGTNSVRCQGARAIPSSLPDGRYFITVSVADADTPVPGRAETARKAIYKCDTISGGPGVELTNGCQYADFDRDDASEGRFTAKYSTEPRACDNCIGWANASQTDNNANGIGDECEPSDKYGRCSEDRDTVCSFDAQDADNGCPGGALCCPSPAVADDSVLDQTCEDIWGICTVGGEICFKDSECKAGGAGGFGKCQDGKTACKRDITTGDSPGCDGVPGTPLCTGADRCENLLYPWLETRHGNIFSGKKILTPEKPPQDRFNATFCVTAKDTILNFNTEDASKSFSDPQKGCAALTDPATGFALPKKSTAYASVLGAIDVEGLRSGRYGQVVEVAPGQLDTVLFNASDQLGGKVFRVKGNAVIGAVAPFDHQFKNGTSSVSGAGLILIDGGNLTVRGNITYDLAAVASPDRLPSVGWIVLKASNGTRGNVYINKSVTTFSGAVYAEGDGGFWTVAPPATKGPLAFTHYGLVMAKEFHLGRSFKSKEQGAERFIYDGRAVANPPPGFADVTRSLPSIGR